MPRELWRVVFKPVKGSEDVHRISTFTDGTTIVRRLDKHGIQVDVEHVHVVA